MHSGMPSVLNKYQNVYVELMDFYGLCDENE